MSNSYKYIKIIKKILKNDLLKQKFSFEKLKQETIFLKKKLQSLKNYHTIYIKNFYLSKKHKIHGKTWENFTKFIFILEKNMNLEKNKFFLHNQKLNDLKFKYIKLKQKIKAWNILEKNKKRSFLSKKNQIESTKNDFLLQLIQMKKK